MREIPEDLRELQGLLDRSIERAGPFLRSSFEMPKHSLNAQQLANHLRGLPTVAMATVTARGEPRVAPISAIFYRGRFHVPTVRSAARTRHLLKRPGVSLSYYEGIDLAVIVQGWAAIIEQSDPIFEDLDGTLVAHEGESVTEWDAGGGIYLRIDPDIIYTFARYPERFPPTA